MYTPAIFGTLIHKGFATSFTITYRELGANAPAVRLAALSGLASSFLSLFLLVLYTVQYRVGIFKESMGARNRGGIGLSYRPARLHRPAEFIH
jgi:hypothetical protein